MSNSNDLQEVADALRVKKLMKERGSGDLGAWLHDLQATDPKGYDAYMREVSRDIERRGGLQTAMKAAISADLK